MQDIRIDKSAWPIVHIIMPTQVEQGAEVAYIEEMQAILDRGEPYVLLFEGPEKLDAPAFNSAYMRWFKKVKARQNELCRGIVRIDPEQSGQTSLISAMKNKVVKMSLSYPYEVCATLDQARAKANQWLTD